MLSNDDPGNSVPGIRETQHRSGPISATGVGKPFLAILLLTACSAEQVRYEVGSPAGPPAAADATLFLLGDGGEITAGRDAVLGHLAEQIESAATASRDVLVAYLGDNIYEVGAREAHRDHDFPRLAAQVEPLGRRANVRTVFVPGNHDWSRGGPDDRGRVALSTQAAWLSGLAEGRDIRLLPEDACPGPIGVPIGSSVHVVIIDTEWLLRAPDDHCGSPEAFHDRLTEELRTNRDRHLVVLGHHPLASGGEHGGNLGVLDGVPVLSWIVRKAGVAVQDIMSRRYQEMIDRLQTSFEAAGDPPLVYAAGHEHNLQVIGSDDGQAFRLVSGAVAKTSPTRRVEGTRFATDGYGYMRLQASGSRVILTVFATRDGGSPPVPVFSCTLTDPAGCPEAPLAPRRP